MPRVLIVDDDDLVRLLLREIAESAGYEVVVAVEGAQALARHREEPVDLIVTDIVMPGREGVSVIFELSRCSPETPVVAISGGGLIGADSHLRLAAAAGAVCTLKKPLRPDAFLAVLRKYLPLDTPASAHPGG